MKDSGVTVEKESIETFFKIMNTNDMDIPTLIKNGEAKLISMPCAGGGDDDPHVEPTTPVDVEVKKPDEKETYDMSALFVDEEEYWARKTKANLPVIPI